MFRLLVVVLSLINTREVQGIERHFKGFASSPVDTRLNAEPIRTLKAASLVQCLVACVSNPGCESFNFGGRGDCELLSTFFCARNADFVSSTGMAYYDVDLYTGSEEAIRIQSSEDCRARHMCSDKCDLIRTLGQSCENEADCDAVIGATCSQGQCQRKAAYHYDRIEDSCVTDCDTFGSTFTATRGYALADNNDYIQLSGHTFNTCMEACLSANFTCLSFEFASAAGSCLLSSTSCSSTGVGVCSVNAHYDYFSRDCA